MASSGACLLSKRATKGTGAQAAKGVCSIFGTRVQWTPDDPMVSALSSIDLSAVTRTQQAPNKPLVRLEAAGGALVLGFGSLADRDQAVDLIKQLKAALPAAVPSAESAAPDAVIPPAAQRAQLFALDRDLETTYRELVSSGVLPEADFWHARRPALARLAASSAAAAAALAPEGPTAAPQRAGLPSSLLADLEPRAEGGAEAVRFTLTPAAIAQIFMERPEVHAAFAARVPSEMTEVAFWTAYLKEHYRQQARRRKGMAADEAADELLAPFLVATQQRERARAAERMRRVDPTVNVAADLRDRYDLLKAGDAEARTGAAPSLEAGQGDPGGAFEEASADAPALRNAHATATLRASRSAAIRELARTLNRHGEVVLQGMPQGVALEEDRDGVAIARKLREAERAEGAKAARDGDGELFRRRAGSALDDLHGPEGAALETLSIREDEQGAAFAAREEEEEEENKGGKRAEGEDYKNDTAPAEAYRAMLALLRRMDPLVLPAPAPAAAASAHALTLELASAADPEILRRFGPAAASAVAVPSAEALLPGLLALLRTQALRTNELLRHFWACIPPADAGRAAKARALEPHLKEQRGRLDAHLKAKPGAPEEVHIAHLMQPLQEAIDAALAAYAQSLKELGAAP